MQETFGAIMLALVDGEPKHPQPAGDALPLPGASRKDVVTRRTQLRPGQGPGPARTSWRACSWPWTNIDEVVQIITTPASIPTPAKERPYASASGFSDKQAQAILDMRLARLTGLEREKLMDEYQELDKTGSPSLQPSWPTSTMLMGVIKDGDHWTCADKFADARRTELITLVTGDIDLADLIQEEDMVVTLTHCGLREAHCASTPTGRSTGAARASWAMATREEDFVEQHVCGLHP